MLVLILQELQDVQIYYSLFCLSNRNVKNLRYRDTSKEILDDLTCSGEAVAQNLKELDLINTLLGGNAISIKALKKVLQQARAKHLSIADLGCGSGQLMIEMHNMLHKKGIESSFVGFDANPFIVNYGINHCKAYSNIAFMQKDVMLDPISEKFDIMHAALFLHHFTEEELIILLSNMRQYTRKAIIINDLHRHSLAYYSIKFLTQLFSKSHMVKHDAALSVAKGFTKKEWRVLIKAAGFTKWEIQWAWAFRHQIILYPSHETIS